jgi:hypothetical protein
VEDRVANSFSISTDRRQFVAGLCGASFITPALSASATGAVESATGVSTAVARGASRALATGADIFVGDLVSTTEFARLVMKLGAATRVHMGASVKLRIDKYLADKAGELRFENGPVLVDRPEAQPHMDFKLRSPYGQVALRGTKVFVGPSNGKFAVFVERGAVDFTAGGQTVRVGAGQGTDVRFAGDKPSPVIFWGSQRIVDALISIS